MKYKTENMKRNIFYTSKWGMGAVAMALTLSLSSCSDFFSPETDDQISADDYIAENTEMYTGFIGILTKMQAVGDKEILLTDTRAEFIEPTANASTDLVNIYNYADNLQGNEYASPAAYYELILACNDYLVKAAEYIQQPQADKDVCKNLISSTIRIKVWAYKTVGEIYGEAAWLEGTVGSVEEYLANGKASVVPMKTIVDNCLNLLEGGYLGVDANLEVDWIAWLDPDNVTNIANSSFRKWNYMVPDYEGLYAELCLWKGAYIDAEQGVGSTTAKAYYKKAADTLLAAINTEVNSSRNAGNNPYWVPNAGTAGRYTNLWQAQDPYAPENVSVILYDYFNNQTNSLVKHFNSDSPAEYLLQPSEAGKNNFLDKTSNPGGSTSEKRYSALVGNTGSGNYISKFRTNGGRNGIRANAYQDDVHIYLYRATQYHLMLCEALNQLERYTALGCVLNTGINGDNQTVVVNLTTRENPIDPNDSIEWEGFTRNWTSDGEFGTVKYPPIGIRGAYSLTARTILTEKTTEAKRANDIQLIKECEMEFSCEGKTYPWMNRVAVRYSDLSIVADEVCPKYESSGKSAQVRAAIMSGGNWVKYNL